jgi:hypothetical protein
MRRRVKWPRKAVRDFYRDLVADDTYEYLRSVIPNFDECCCSADGDCSYREFRLSDLDFCPAVAPTRVKLGLFIRTTPAARR